MRVFAKKMGAFIAAAAVAAGMLAGAAVGADETIDYTKKGSISVDVKTNDTKKPVSGATIAIIEVAKAQDVDGSPSFVYTSAFEDCGIPLEGISEDDPGAASLAGSLASYIAGKQVSGKTGVTDSNGLVSWSGLELGLYLVVNTKAADGYDKMKPFLMTVPRIENGSYVYEVNASPKPATAPKKDGGKTPTPTPTPTTPGGGGRRIPQTGQLWWPVIALAAAGLVLILFGLFRKKSGSYEAKIK